MILSMAEQKSQQNIMTRKLEALLQVPKQNGSRNNKVMADDPLFGLPADHIDVWNNFDNRLRKDRKFYDAVVKS